MPRSRARRVRHPATGPLFLAALYLIATAANVVLALTMASFWPTLLAAVLAAATIACVATALRRVRRPAHPAR